MLVFPRVFGYFGLLGGFFCANPLPDTLAGGSRRYNTGERKPVSITSDDHAVEFSCDAEGCAASIVVVTADFAAAVAEAEKRDSAP